MMPMITVSRQYGTGGHDIAERLAAELKLPFYDRDLITIAARESGIGEDAFDQAEQAATTTLGYMLSNRSNRTPYGMPLNDRLFMVQSGIIRTIADRGPALFVGRCADYVLDGYKPCINIFLQAELQHRVETVMQRERLGHREAEERVRRLDKSRATYYNYYTDRRWSDLKNYDIALNVTHLQPGEAAELLALFVRKAAEAME